MKENIKQLKDYKGFEIYKDYSTYNGKILKDTIIYHAYTKDGEYFNSKNDLKNLKLSIDLYVNM